MAVEGSHVAPGIGFAFEGVESFQQAHAVVQAILGDGTAEHVCAMLRIKCLVTSADPAGLHCLLRTADFVPSVGGHTVAATEDFGYDRADGRRAAAGAHGGFWQAQAGVAELSGVKVVFVDIANDPANDAKLVG